jgi:hypothetical protein
LHHVHQHGEHNEQSNLYPRPYAQLPKVFLVGASLAGDSLQPDEEQGEEKEFR